MISISNLIGYDMEIFYGDAILASRGPQEECPKKSALSMRFLRKERVGALAPHK
jgi:hypothetical protein